MPFKKRILLFSLLYCVLRFVTSGRKLNIFLFCLACSFHSRFIFFFRVSDEVLYEHFSLLRDLRNEHFYDEFFLYIQTTIINLSILTSSIYHINEKAESYQLTKNQEIRNHVSLVGYLSESP